jgi:two-component system sensor histidine kinase YesM
LCKEVNFSKSLAIVYTLIIAIPLLILLFIGSEYLRITMYRSIALEAEKAVADNTLYVETRVDQIERLESIITSDYELLRTFYFSEASDKELIIATLRTDLKNLERLQFAMPQIYALRLFVRNPNIPERWPILFREERFDFGKFGRWTYNYRDEVMGNIESTKELSACLTREVFLNINKKHLGYLQLSVKMVDFFPFLFKEEDPYYRDYVFYKNESVMGAEEGINPIRDEVLAEEQSKKSGSFQVRLGNETRIVAYSRIPRLDLVIVHTSSPAVITNSIFMIRTATLILLLVSIALMFAVINFTTKKMVTRLYVVIDGMRKIREGNLDVKVMVSGNDEVAEMSRTFSAMVERIQKLVFEIKNEQALVTQTEIKAMQNQINAHFLYNVLETIKMQAELNDQREVAQSITLLGRMMRYCLKWRIHRVKITQEIDYISDYIELMNIRNDYAISLSIDIDEKYLSYEIPKMLIQPVIENAVMHAIEPLGEDAKLELTASADPDGRTLNIRVTDFGMGMGPERLALLAENLSAGSETDAPVGGIGLLNIQQRLHAFYGTKYSLKILSAPGAGTSVIIPVPLENSRC